MVSIYEIKIDLLILKVARFETGKPIGKRLKSQNLRKMAPGSGLWQDMPREA